jgi:hypothetical protein
LYHHAIIESEERLFLNPEESMKKLFTIMSVMIVLPGLQSFAQEGDPEQPFIPAVFITMSIGSPALGPAWNIGRSMTKMGYDQTQHSHFIFSTTAEHPNSKWYIFENIPLNASLRYRITGNILLSASFENTMVVETNGFNGQNNISASSYLRTYSAALQMIIGESPSYFWFGAGPSFHQIFLAPLHFRVEDYDTREKIGVTVQGGIFAMMSERMYLEMGAHIRFVGTVSVPQSSFTTYTTPPLSTIEANYNHLFFSVGIGTSF